MTTAEAVERAMQAVQTEKKRIASIVGRRFGSIYVEADSLINGVLEIENAMLEVQNSLQASGGAGKAG